MNKKCHQESNEDHLLLNIIRFVVQNKNDRRLGVNFILVFFMVNIFFVCMSMNGLINFVYKKSSDDSNVL